MKYEPTKTYVSTKGRTLIKEGVLYLGYSCTGLEFTCTTKKIEATLWTDGEKWEPDLRAVMAVFVDGEVYKRFTLNEAEARYVLYEEEEEKTVKISLIKLSEAAFAKVGVKALYIEGNDLPRPTSPRKRKIEFIGDSITCGYGIEGEWNKTTFNTKEENPWEAYAAKTARALDADYHLISWSGNGIISGWTENGEIQDECLMPELYEYTNLCLERALGCKKFEKWDSNKFQADCVVINLGTNDASYTKGKLERIADFGEAYYSFLKGVRQKQPNAYIVCTLGVMGKDLYPEIEAQVARFRKQEGDERLVAMAFAVQDEKDGIGTDWHPSLMTHGKMAKQLIDQLQELLSWR